LCLIIISNEASTSLQAPKDTVVNKKIDDGDTTMTAKQDNLLKSGDLLETFEQLTAEAG